jgi:2-dehydro-3-deoxyphosphogluconate aldolase / (4S)-4-hydroxy-2-oxoglutarate aldolase
MYEYNKLLNTLNENPIVPVVAIESSEDVIPLAKSLVDGGVKIIEITLRTPAAIGAMKKLIAANVGIIIGAGTVCTVDQFKTVEDINADFIVSPGHTDELLNYAKTSEMPYLPGVMTSSEVLKVMNAGFKIQKLFPASLAGGIKAVQAYGSVYSAVKFCPTGGVNAKNFTEFLSQKNVCAVGGTWLASKNEISENNWESIKNKTLEIQNILNSKVD